MVRRDHKQRGPSSSPHTPTDQPNTLCLQAPQLLSFALRTKCEVKERMHICIYQYICTSRLIAANKRRYPPEHRTRAGGGGWKGRQPCGRNPTSPGLPSATARASRAQKEGARTNKQIYKYTSGRAALMRHRSSENNRPAAHTLAFAGATAQDMCQRANARDASCSRGQDQSAEKRIGKNG